MARLSDLIKKGKIPEKKQKDEVKIRDLASLKEEKKNKEEVVKKMTSEQIAKAHVLIDDYKVWLYPFR